MGDRLFTCKGFAERQRIAAVNPSEDQIQIALIEWCQLQRNEIRHTFHIPNEAKRSRAGYGIQAAKGTRTGASDLMIPAARAGWNGFFLELKASGKPMTDAQVEFHNDMRECGYYTACADNLDDAIALIERYECGAFPRADWVSYSHPVAKA